MHLSFIVDQTEKYSTWLTEGLTTAASSQTSQTLELESTSTSIAHEPASPAPSMDGDGMLDEVTILNFTFHFHAVYPNL